MSAAPPVVITRWASQAGRRRAALEPGYVGVDERSFPELLAFAPAFARHVRYFDLHDRPHGDWSDFFLADSVMVLASMACFDVTAQSRAFHTLLRQVRAENSDGAKLERLKILFDTILALPRMVDDWYRMAQHLADGAGALALRGLLSSAIGRELAPLLDRLRAYGAGAGQPGALGRSIPVDCRHFQPIWRAEYVCPDGSIYRGHFRRQKIDWALGPLAGLFESLLSGVADLAAQAKHELDGGAAIGGGRHKPHIALYMAFAKALQVAQGQLNALPARVIDFYYREVLREPLRPALPDRMFLTFALAPGADVTSVSHGTQFPAGAAPDGAPILFTADQGIDVTPARLAQIRSLRAVRGPLLKGGTRAADDAGDRLHYIWEAEAAVGPDGVLSPDGPWLGFGSPATQTLGAAPAQPAPLGFVIASRSLLLTGGQRSITLTLSFAAQSEQSGLDPLLQQITQATGLAADEALSAVASEAFAFSVTTPAGWQPIPPVEVVVSATRQDRWSLAFELLLPVTALPLTAPDPTPAAPPLEPGPPPRLPAVLARLSQDPVGLTGQDGTVYVHPLALLEGLSLDDVTIGVTVSSLPGIGVKTIAGPVDATTPFLPFGAPARAGAWFEVHHPELTTKPLDRIDVTLNWLGLPTHPRGFAGHYEQYLVGPDRETGFAFINNRSFLTHATLSGFAPWTLAASDPLHLFSTGDPRAAPDAAGPLAPATTLSFTAAPRPEGELPGLNGAALRLTLGEPPFGFADELYPPNVLNAVQAMQPQPQPAPRRWFNFLRRHAAHLAAVVADIAHAYPNPPWQPQLASILLGYVCSTRVDLAGQVEFLHLLPTGELAPAVPDANGAVALLPIPAQSAYFDLGFSDLASTTTLTLLFRMASEGSVGDERSGVQWRIGTADGPVELMIPDEHADGSYGLRQSGILSLDLPSLDENDASADDLYWLRATPAGSPDGFPGMVAVTPHALTATRIIAGDAGVPALTPAKAVKAAMPALPAIALIDQPLASFGGSPTETPATQPIRLGERLRHKERACLAWDYERLVLERFPEIAKVRVLPARDGAGGRKPGEVLLVVVPGPGGIHVTDPLVPATTLDARARVQASLRDAATPFVAINVVDPVYVRIAVRARLLFRAQANGHGPKRLNDDLREFLSPWGDGLDLSDDAGAAEINTALASFIRTRPYVADLVSLDLSFTPAFDTLQWCVLTSAGSHDIRVAPHGRTRTRSNHNARPEPHDHAYV